MPNFYNFSQKEKGYFWRYRYYLKEIGSALPKFLMSVNWRIENNAQIAMVFMENWALIDFDDALFLLSKNFSLNSIYPSEYSKKLIIFKIVETENFEKN